MTLAEGLRGGGNDDRSAGMNKALRKSKFANTVDKLDLAVSERSNAWRRPKLHDQGFVAAMSPNEKETLFLLRMPEGKTRSDACYPWRYST